MAALPTFSFLVLFLALYSFQLSPAAAAILGGWQPIKDLDDPAVVKVAKFAVTEYNKKPNAFVLTFQRVQKGETQVVAGLNYRLEIVARNANLSLPAKSGNYAAVVYQKAGGKALELVSFKRLLQD